MILLTLYREPEGKKENREFGSLHEAIEFGQKAGTYYDIYDPATGKVIDWNEINVRDEDEWYYDEKEYLWKKFGPDDGYYSGMAVKGNLYGFLNQAPAFSGASMRH
jgi:hypothetical protein